MVEPKPPKPPKTNTELMAILGKIGVALIPLIVAVTAYIEAETASRHAAKTATATAVESATSELSYAQVVEKLNQLEAKQRQHDLEIATAHELAVEHHPQDAVKVSTTTPSVEEAKAAIRLPPPPLAAERPAPPPLKVEQAKAAIEKAQVNL